jgi:hypothetical protein
MTYKIDKKDLDSIISNAKSNMSRLNLPIYVSRKEVGNHHLPSMAILESVLTFLNGKSLLAGMVKVNYTDPTAEHDNEAGEMEKE